jgi:hypothetical protein
MKFKFEIGQTVRHRAGERWSNKMLVMSRGAMENHDGTHENMYLVSYRETGHIGRAFLHEFEMEEVKKDED